MAQYIGALLLGTIPRKDDTLITGRFRGLHQIRQDHFRQAGDCPEIDVNLFVNLLQRILVFHEIIYVLNAGVVDEDVERREMRGDVFHHASSLQWDSKHRIGQYVCRGVVS